MKPARKKRLFFIVFLIAGVALAAGFAMYAFNQNLMFYFSPSDVNEGKAPKINYSVWAAWLLKAHLKKSRRV